MTSTMPPRRAMGLSEILSMAQCIFYYWRRGLDPGYDGKFEDLFCEKFSEFQGGGYSDAVSSGCASLLIALKCANLPKGSIVATSPVTDASVIGAICELGHIPYLIDSGPDSYNVTLGSVQDRWNRKIKAFILTHAGGEPCDAGQIAKFCAENECILIEDCSQAIGAIPKGETKRVGRYGLAGCFSTMYRKNLSASGSSGILFSNDETTYRLAKQHADRGKKWWDKELVDMRDPGFADFPGLNFNSDELRCAIGLASLARLEDTNARRRKVVSEIVTRLNQDRDSIFTPYAYHDGFSPFYFPIFVKQERIKSSMKEVTDYLQSLGLSIGTKYGCLVWTWNWARPLMFDTFDAPNALQARDQCFHLYVNEKQKEKHIHKILEILKKASTNKNYIK